LALLASAVFKVLLFFLLSIECFKGWGIDNLGPYFIKPPFRASFALAFESLPFFKRLFSLNWF